MTPAAYLTTAGSENADEAAEHLASLSRRDLASLAFAAGALRLRTLVLACVAEDARRDAEALAGDEAPVISGDSGVA